MSEHDNGFDHQRWLEYQGACAAASTGSLLLVPGIEYGDPDNIVHIPVWGEVPFLGSGNGTFETLRRSSDAGGFAVLAHPWRRRAWDRFDENWLAHLSGVEIWNRKYDGIAPNRDVVTLARRAGIAPIVSLDFHNRRQFFPLSMSLEIEGALTREAVWAALGVGAFTPMAMSMSALKFTSGLPGRAIAALELGRRHTARLLRNARG
jgi:hypothetical protein